MFALTSDGNPYARFRRALETGNETLVVAAARELPQVSLDDALRICLVLRGGDPAATSAPRSGGWAGSRSRLAR